MATQRKAAMCLHKTITFNVIAKFPDGREITKPEIRNCGSQALPNGWCEAHQWCDEILVQVRSAGWPTLWVNPCLCIAGGRESWEDYLRYVPDPVRVLQGKPGRGKTVLPGHPRLSQIRR